VKKTDLATYRNELESFLKEYGDYLHSVHGAYYRGNVELRTSLQRRTPLIARIVSVVNDRGSYTIQKNTFSFHETLAFTLQEDADEKDFWGSTKAHVIRTINESIGNIDNDTIPTRDIKPRLPIRDDILNQRCLTLINSGVPFDTVIREATLVFEERLRTKISHDRISEIFPSSAEQTGEKLVNRLLSVENPVIVISEDKGKREAFLKMTRGIFAYWRNPFHHTLNDKTKLSLAWSVVGVIDSLLSEIDASPISDAATSDSAKKETK